MPYRKTIICLANSIKHHPFRCIAGKDVNGENDWIRPVTADREAEGAIPRTMTICSDRREIDILDIAEIQFSAPAPRHCQTENHLVVPDTQWKKCGRIGWDDLDNLVDHTAGLWGTNSSRSGLNDQISVEDARRFNDSLRLIKPSDFVVHVQEVRGQNGPKPTMRGTFRHMGRRYSLSVTDPFYKDQIRNFAIGTEIRLDDVYVTVSVSDEFRERAMHYKLIAAIITPDRC